jgi:hypothetical protein
MVLLKIQMYNTKNGMQWLYFLNGITDHEREAWMFALRVQQHCCELLLKSFSLLVLGQGFLLWWPWGFFLKHLQVFVCRDDYVRLCAASCRLEINQSFYGTNFSHKWLRWEGRFGKNTIFLFVSKTRDGQMDSQTVRRIKKVRGTKLRRTKLRKKTRRLGQTVKDKKCLLGQNVD